jgi:hypothetical protein
MQRLMLEGMPPADAAAAVTPARETTTGKYPPWLARATCLAWLCLYLADLRVIVDTPTHLLLAPVFVMITFPVARWPKGQLRYVCALLFASSVFQKIVTFATTSRSTLEILLLAYFFSLVPVRDPKGLRWIGKGLALFFASSFLLLIGTILSDPIRELRSALYQRSDAFMSNESFEFQMLSETAHFGQAGFAYFLHVFSYQTAAGAVMLLGFVIYAKGKVRTLWSLAGVLGFAALFFTGERSAAVAALAAASVMLVAARRPGVLLGVMVVMGIALWLGSEYYSHLAEVREHNTLERAQSIDDVGYRMRLQWWAFQKCLQYPFGLQVAGIDYRVLLGKELPEYSIAPHNGYLTRTLSYGWLVAVIAFFMVAQVVRMARATLETMKRRRAEDAEVGALFGLLAAMVNALFHNASILTFEANTLAVLLLFVAIRDARPDPFRAS